MEDGDSRDRPPRASRSLTLLLLATVVTAACALFYSVRTSFPAYLAGWGELLLGDVQSNVLAIVEQRAERLHSS